MSKVRLGSVPVGTIVCHEGAWGVVRGVPSGVRAQRVVDFWDHPPQLLSVLELVEVLDE